MFKGKTENQIRAWLKIKLNNLLYVLYVLEKQKIQKISDRLGEIEAELNLQIREMRK